ncbi:hypothetical protein Arnit_1335 [Arcobacter nitrofigilis DSM 7299]|uniref:Uncharacterized protein n=1 Tax=Arcobacter nitrofigilis (strain ATCC 33309 / DSM 7299 / CCUG 15893 / LMG 7604 / NCTC 12251 / CI) TaxID=572480 RepID=D5V558_ARCNC|nr:hypothetical protein [Arcobacter nitrofigilis]ADG92993.1 hypothetical protein Arnit_1335 [Arcobacter nitrofigilis DSM 7299]
MKKIFLSLLIITSLVKAENLYSKLHEEIFQRLFSNKKEILIYNIGNPEYSFKNIKYTKELYKSDLIYINEYYRLKIINDKPILASSLIQLNYYKNAIGVFYIEKQKAKIFLVRDRLIEHNIVITDYLEQYIIYEKIYTF